MVWVADRLWCDGCGIEMARTAVRLHGRSYCCEDCAHGKACHCQPPTEEELRVRDAPGSVMAQGSDLIDD